MWVFNVAIKMAPFLNVTSVSLYLFFPLLVGTKSKGYQPKEKQPPPMFEFLIPLLCVFLYMMFRPGHIEAMINSMWFEYPNYIDESLLNVTSVSLYF